MWFTSRQGLSQPCASSTATVGAGIAKVTTATATAQPPSTSLQQIHFAKEQDTVGGILLSPNGSLLLFPCLMDCLCRRLLHHTAPTIVFSHIINIANTSSPPVSLSLSLVPTLRSLPTSGPTNGCATNRRCMQPTRGYAHTVYPPV